MFNSTSTNTDIITHDWAQHDRVALLRSLHATPAPRAATATSGWGTDAAGDDRRSVRAYLRGKGDLRAIWWNLYSALYTAIVPGATLDRAMYSFHRLHHAVTLGWLSYVVSVGKTTADIKQQGLLAAVRAAVVDGASGQR